MVMVALCFLDIYRPILWWEFGEEWGSSECLAIPASSHHSILQTNHHHSITFSTVTQILDLDILPGTNPLIVPPKCYWGSSGGDRKTIFYLRTWEIFSLSQIFPGMFRHVSFRSLYFIIFSKEQQDVLCWQLVHSVPLCHLGLNHNDQTAAPSINHLS